MGEQSELPWPHPHTGSNCIITLHSRGVASRFPCRLAYVHFDHDFAIFLKGFYDSANYVYDALMDTEMKTANKKDCPGSRSFRSLLNEVRRGHMGVGWPLPHPVMWVWQPLPHLGGHRFVQVDEVVITGHSLGAAVAAVLAVLFKDRRCSLDRGPKGSDLCDPRSHHEVSLISAEHCSQSMCVCACM